MDLLCGGEDDVMNVFQMVIFQILLRLPVRSLLRFRSVCKRWCELIDSRVFRDTYLALRRAMPVDDQLIILETINIPDDNDDGMYRISPISLTCRYGDYQSVVAYYDSAPSSSSCCNDFEISGNFSEMTWIVNHLDGVVCFIDEGDYWRSKLKNYTTIYNNKFLELTLLNPALREIRKLPVPVFDLLGGIFRRCVQGIGFGYDDSRNEYKVVAIVTVYEDEEGYGAPCKHIAMVYHLSTNSWTIMDDIYEFMSQPLVSFSSFQWSVFSHGSLHWCIHEDVGPEIKYRILAFDVTSESFREMPFPRGYTYHSPYDNDAMDSCLFKVDKSTIALVASTIQTYAEPVVEVWVMKEYGDNDSWTKRCTITNLPEFVKPVCFRNEDEILLCTHHSEWLCYDLRKMQVVDGIATPESLHAVTGHESFVSVKQV